MSRLKKRSDAPSEVVRPKSELARAAFFYAAFILLFFQASWRSQGIASPDLFVRFDAAKAELDHGGEDLRQFFSWFRFASDNLRKGDFPSWTPFSGAGQPFVGKQQNAVFYPLNALVYLCGDPRIFLIELMLRYFLAAMFTFLLARRLEIRFWPALSAGAVYMISNCMTHWGIHAYSASGAFVPCVLLLAERYLAGFDRRALRLLPFAVALSMLGGHSESAIRGYLLAGIYLSARLWAKREIPAGERIWALARFAGWASLGGALSMVHLLPSAEYYFHSFTHVWRNLAEFAFSKHHVARGLTGDDALLLAAGSAGVFLFGWALKGLPKDLDASSWGSAAARTAASVLGLAAFLAAGSSLGLTMDFWPHLTLQLKYDATQASWVGPAGWAFGFCSLTFAAWALLDPEAPLSIRILGWVFLAGLALIHRAPLLSHLVFKLPLLDQFLPELSPETDLCLALLAAYGFDRLCAASLEPAPKRLRRAALLLAVWGVLLAGAFLSFPLRAPLVDWTGVGQNPLDAGRDPYVAILDGGQRLETAPYRHEVRVRVDRRAGPVGKVLVGLAATGMHLGPIEAAPTKTTADYSYYKGSVDVSTALEANPFALVATTAGTRQILGSSELVVHQVPAPPSLLVPLAMALGLAALFWLGPRALTGGVFALLLAWGFARGAAYFQPRSPARSELLPDLPAVDYMRSDKTLSRLYSFDDHLFGPELSSNYGLSDFRTWDALDVLEHVFFLRLLQSSATRDKPAAQKLLDLANIKYVLTRPKDNPPLPGLSAGYRGELAVYANPTALPRAAFVANAASLPAEEFKDWRAAMQRGLPILGGMLHQGLDPARTVLLHDPLATTGGQPAASGRAEVVEYRIDSAKVRVEAPTAGFLFMSDTYFPGWKATVDGNEASLLRAWLNFRAVPVPAGAHTVDFVYRPLSLLAGAVVSLAALIALLWLWAAEKGPLDLVEGMVLANVLFGMLYWGVWCAWTYRGGNFFIRTAGFGLLIAVGLVGNKIYRLLLQALAVPQLQHQKRP